MRYLPEKRKYNEYIKFCFVASGSTMVWIIYLHWFNTMYLIWKPQLELNVSELCEKKRSMDIQTSNVKELYCYNEKIENLSREQE